MIVFAIFLDIFIQIISLNGDCSSNNYEWMYYQAYGSNVTLKPLKRTGIQTYCGNETILSCEWTLPNGQNLFQGILSLLFLFKWNITKNSLLRLF
jgi:hypothetical protein